MRWRKKRNMFKNNDWGVFLRGRELKTKEVRRKVFFLLEKVEV
jgi:hypothetical protein